MDLGIWSERDNWNPGGEPRTGDVLIFPSGQLSQRRYISTNDLGNLNLSQITISDNKYIISGQDVTLSTGLNATYGSGSASYAIATTFTNDAKLSLANGLLTVYGIQTFNGTSSIQVTNGILKFNHQIQTAQATFHKTGNGVMQISGMLIGMGSSPITTSIDAGVLQADGQIVSSSILVGPGATLSGSGTVQNVSVASLGTLAPGSYVNSSPGILHTGGVTFAKNSTYSVKIDSSNDTTGYGRVIASGPIDLSAYPTLSLNMTYSPVPGESYTILQGTSVTGHFQGFPEGSTFKIGTDTYVITYQGANHGVVITCASIVSPASSRLPSTTLLAMTGRGTIQRLSISVLVDANSTQEVDGRVALYRNNRLIRIIRLRDGRGSAFVRNIGVEQRLKAVYLGNSLFSDSTSNLITRSRWSPIAASRQVNQNEVVR